MIDKIKQQVRFAETKHGKFTGSLEYKTMILIEEMGEAIREANNIIEHGKGYINLELELAQIGAVVIRYMESIQDNVIEEKDKQMEIF